MTVVLLLSTLNSEKRENTAEDSQYARLKFIYCWLECLQIQTDIFKYLQP